MSRDFDGWLQAVRVFGILHWGFDKGTKLAACGWRPYFDDGLTPMQALREDLGQPPKSHD